MSVNPASADKNGVEHGRYRYVHYRCRCEVCTAANTDYQVRRDVARAAELAAGTATVPHGTSGGYKNWGCRCESCTHARRVENRRPRPFL